MSKNRGKMDRISKLRIVSVRVHRRQKQMYVRVLSGDPLKHLTVTYFMDMYIHGGFIYMY